MSSSPALDTFFAELRAALGDDAVNRSDETLTRYGENKLPSGLSDLG